jgi:hypothetical protein
MIPTPWSRLPLPVREELAEHAPLDRLSEISAGGSHRPRFSPDEIRRPLRPRPARVPIAERGVERVVLDPVGLRPSERVERLAEIRGGAGLKPLPGQPKERILERADLLELHLAGVEGRPGHIRRPEEVVRDQEIGTQQQGVDGEGRRRGVWRAAEAHGTERQDLPPALAGARQKVDPGMRGGPHIADAVGRRQRGNVKQDARAAHRQG